MNRLLGIISVTTLMLLSPAAGAKAPTPLPLEVLSGAVSESLPHDSDFDYVRLGRTNNLRIFPPGYRAPKHLVDHVIVNKLHHQMFLMKNNQVVRKYWIALSDKPVGRKQFQGDHRTPEGTYTLDYIKEHSNFYRAFHISYPNPADIANARAHNARPGGLIMVHGQPLNRSGTAASVQRSDWTDGCIALLNHEMDDFLNLVDVGTPITINP